MGLCKRIMYVSPYNCILIICSEALAKNTPETISWVFYVVKIRHLNALFSVVTICLFGDRKVFINH